MVNQIKQLPRWGFYALLAYMPFHIFLSQSVSLLTGGLDIWKGAKDALTFIILIISVALAFAYKQKIPKYYWYLVFASSVYGLLHMVIYVINKDTSLSVAMLATAYNCRLFAYLIIGATVGVLINNHFEQTRLIKIILIISTLVAVLGILQYFLPKDLLTHLGYSIDRGVKPNFFINEDPTFPRIMSTLRDPNSLGAFLLVPIVLLVQLIKNKSKHLKLLGALLTAHVLALYLSFSRAAWAGLVIALGLLFYLSHKDKILPVLKHFWLAIAALVFIFAFSGYMVRNTQFVRSVVFRIDDKNPADQLDSDKLHVHFIEEGIHDMGTKPFGYGPGTAGIVSIQNQNGSYLTENYYLQIAHEVGLIGLAIFLGLIAYVVWLLLRSKTMLNTALIMSMGAYMVMALVMHLWTNEAVAAQWWLVTGAALSLDRPSKGKQV